MLNNIQIENLEAGKTVKLTDCLNQSIEIEPGKKGFIVYLNNASKIEYWNKEKMYSTDVFKNINQIIETLNEKYSDFQELQGNSKSIANIIRKSVQFGISGKIRLDPNHKGFYKTHNLYFSAMESRDGVDMYLEKSENVRHLGSIKDFGFSERKETGKIAFAKVSELPLHLEAVSLSEIIEAAKKEKTDLDNSKFALNWCEGMGYDY